MSATLTENKVADLIDTKKAGDTCDTLSSVAVVSSQNTNIKTGHKLPSIDPTKTESRGAAPQAYIEHFIWSLKNDSMILIYKFMFTFFVGMSFYLIATINPLSFFLLSFVWPMILLIIHQFFYDKIFVSHFGWNKHPLPIVKYITFASQNAILCFIYWYGTDEILAEVSTWFVRLNIVEVTIACIVQRLYIYWIPSLMLSLPFIGWGDAAFNNFPRLSIVRDDKYLMVWEDWDPWFIIIYTGWFLGWILHASHQVSTAMHTLFPLFGPPQLWFSIRSFTGGFLLWWVYLTPIQKYVNTPESYTEQSGFSEIYDAVYGMVFLGCYAMPFCMEYISV